MVCVATISEEFNPKGKEAEMPRDVIRSGVSIVNETAFEARVLSSSTRLM